MKSIGKSYGGFNLYPIAPKRYQCDRCGHISTQSTNHFQPTWSAGRMNVCPACPPWAKYPEFGGSTTWTCLDKEPEESTTESIKQQADLLLEAVKCECADPACPVCGGHCSNRATVNLRRVDMDDATGTMFCAACSEDAMSAGLFMPSVSGYIAGTRRGQPRPKAAEMQVSWT